MIKIIDNVDDVNNDNCDVEVTIGDSQFVLTLFTVQNIEKLMKSYNSTGECLNGSFFAASNMLVVKDLKTSTIESTLNQLIKTRELEEYFKSSS